METAPWQRQLLSFVEENEQGLTSVTPEAILLALAVAFVLVLVVLLCVCDDGSANKTATDLRAVSRKSTNAEDPAAVSVDVEAPGEPTQTPGSPAELTVNSNGVAGRNAANATSHARQASSGSGQMRPTSLRELPDLPGSNHKRNHSGAGIVDKPAAAWNSQHPAGGGEEGDNNSYDHLGVKINNTSKAATNYDHIKLESSPDPGSGATPVSEPDTASDGHYAQVRERTYDVVQDVKARASVKSGAADFDPYSKVRDDDDDDKEDPYTKVKDGDRDDIDDDYAHLKHDHVISVSAAANAAGSSLGAEEEDPYERVMGDSAGSQAQVAAFGGDTDDPYTQVGDQSSVTVVPIRSTSQRGEASTSPSNVTSSAAAALRGDRFHLQFADDDDAEGQDDYAVVVKERRGSALGEEGSGGRGPDDREVDEIEPYFSTPPEPPRMYGASEVGGVQGAVGGAGVSDGAQNGQHHDSKEHRYTKVTARESLASMTARNALNTYEIVPDLPENTYATVEGGSGDGVVRYSTPSQPTLQHSSSLQSETYAEIGVSASGSYTPSAPEPPSLHSLHSMTKSTMSVEGEREHSSRGLSSPSGGASGVIVAEDGYAVVTKTSNFSPSETALPQIPRPSASSSAHSLDSLGEQVVIDGVTLHPDYHKVKDCIPDQDSENDPNYESVDEALSKAPPASSNPASSEAASAAAAAAALRVTVSNVPASPSRRTHEYEEVSPPASPVVLFGRQAVGTAAVNTQAERRSNGAVVSGIVPSAYASSGANVGVNVSSAEAAEVRDRVLRGHMYEDISDMKKPGGSAS